MADIESEVVFDLKEFIEAIRSGKPLVGKRIERTPDGPLTTDVRFVPTEKGLSDGNDEGTA